MLDHYPFFSMIKAAPIKNSKAENNPNTEAASNIQTPASIINPALIVSLSSIILSPPTMASIENIIAKTERIINSGEP